jgi:hypothetical protein
MRKQKGLAIGQVRSEYGSDGIDLALGLKLCSEEKVIGESRGVDIHNPGLGGTQHLRQLRVFSRVS